MSKENEIKNCQNCKNDFTIEGEDFKFYEKIKVPPPTFCPECRYYRRAIWRKVRSLFRGKDAITGKEIFTSLPPQTNIPLYELSYWLSDNWDPMAYGINYDFSKSFFDQFNDLFHNVPFPAMDKQRCINSDYSNMCDDMKNAYLCFNVTFIEDSAYCVGGSKLKNCFDMNSCYENELCYENVRVDKSYNVIGSVMIESCVDVYFSKNCVGCNNCLGCVNLRNSSYMIFNLQYSKEEYFEKIKSYDLDTWEGFNNIKQQAEDFWKEFPIKYMLGFRNNNVSGEDIKDSKNVLDSYIIKGGENLKYVQDASFGSTADSYDLTSWGLNTSQVYESVVCGENVDQLKFCYACYPNCRELEYCINVRRCQYCFGCAGIKDKQYCILNKQYSKEEYYVLVEKIKKHMDEMPYVDKKINVYKYGEFFPTDFSPYAYNETLLNDQFPSNKEIVEKMGFVWREPNRKEYEITINAFDLPDSIKQVSENILKEIIGCLDCKRAYRVTSGEYNFLKNINLPLPRYCVDCRFLKRQKFIASPSFEKEECACMCGGEYSTDLKYKNNQKHFHNGDRCSNVFQTAYDKDNEIIYCEECYKKEVY